MFIKGRITARIFFASRNKFSALGIQITDKRGIEYLIMTKERLVLTPIIFFFIRSRNILF